MELDQTDRAVKNWGMDLTYPAEAEAFRAEIRTWLEDHLPAGWFDEGFEMTADEKKAFNEDWTQELFDGGWICATWPTEYGGKGLSTIQGVVLAEEFARAKAPMRADFFGDTLVGPTILMNGTEEQKKYFLPKILNGTMRWCQGFSEPNSGSDLASLTTSAVLDGDEWVINGEKIFVTAGSRATHIVVWATVDKTLGRAAIKSFVVPREHPGVIVERLEHKLGIKASDTAVIRFENARIPKDNLLGSPEIEVEKGFAGVMETFDATRPIVAAMAVGVARAALEELRTILTDAGVEISYDKPAHAQSAAAAEFLRMEADWESGYLLTVRSAWQADNRIPNSKEASMGKAKAARVGSDITLKAVEMAGTTGYSEQTLLEKWARDSKILDIFEGTQQIQQLVIARRLLGLSSAELK